MKLVLASRNRKKIAELRDLLAENLPGAEVLSLDDIGYYGEIEEDGTSFSENALIKARVAASGGYIGIGDDSGLTVDALGGAPGIYSARWSVMEGRCEKPDDEENNRLLLDKLAGKPFEERGAAYECCVACVLPDGREFTVQEEVRGHILGSYVGEGGFGYDPLFFCDVLQKTFAEVPVELKHTVSHRGKAMRAFAAQLKKILEEKV